MTRLFNPNEKYAVFNNALEIRFQNVFEFSDNDIAIFIGPNGIGKSTLAKIFTNFIDYNSINCSKFGSRMLFHPQELIFLPGSVYEDFEIFLNAHEDRIKEIDQNLYDFYERYKNQSVSSLSGGERQLFLLLKTVLACKGLKGEKKDDIAGIVFDEPSKQLCHKNFAQLEKIFFKCLLDLKLSLFFITHEIKLIHAICEYYLRHEKTIHFIEIKEESAKVRTVSHLGGFNRKDIEENWKTISSHSEYLSGFLGRGVNLPCCPASKIVSKSLGKVVFSYPLFSGIYKIIAEDNGNENEYLSLTPRNHNYDLTSNDVIHQFR